MCAAMILLFIMVNDCFDLPVKIVVAVIVDDPSRRTTFETFKV